MELSAQHKSDILKAQKKEITEFHLYSRLSEKMEDEKHKMLLEKIANDELRHYNFWQSLSNEEVLPSKTKYYFYNFLTKILGLTFSIRLMEKGEVLAQETYNHLLKTVPDVKKILIDEEGEKNPLHLSLYTGTAYVITVIILILPFFFYKTPLYALLTTLSFAILVIFFFTFYTAVARNQSFKRKFLEMAMISLGVAILNFFIGYLMKRYILGV